MDNQSVENAIPNQSSGLKNDAKNALELHMRKQIRSRRPIKALTGAFPPNKSAGLSARSRVTSQVHEAYICATAKIKRPLKIVIKQPSSKQQNRLNSRRNPRLGLVILCTKQTKQTFS